MTLRPDALQTRVLSSPDELRAHAARWDALWQASDSRLPSLLAEPIAVWFESFAKGEAVRLIVVEEAGRFVAALPLRGQRHPSGLRMGALFDNAWTGGADLLLRHDADARACIAAIVSELPSLPWKLLWLEGLDPDRPTWRTFREVVTGRRMATQRHDLYRVGTIEVRHDWRAYLASRSRSHRQNMRTAAHRFEAAGGGELVVHDNPAPAQLEPLLQRGFEVERRSWKAQSGTAVLQMPHAYEFYRRQARALSAAGHLRLVFLEHAGQAIAFEYGWWAKGTYFTPKFGYDEAFAHLSPGQLLRYRLFERLHADPACRRVDFSGLMTNTLARWATGSYTVSRLLVGVRGPFAYGVLPAYRVFRTLLLAVLAPRIRKRLGPRAAEASVEVRPLPDESGGRAG